MIIKKISIYDEFECTGAECPVNCCKGWKIPLDEAICEKYRRKKKVLGRRFHFFVDPNEGMPTFRNVFGRCPFWGRDHLCKIQKEYGEEYMAAVCRQFPRRLYNLGFFCEETLYLACPEAVRLFLASVNRGEHFGYKETEEQVTYEVDATNDDEEFLSYLMTARKQLTGMLGEAFCFDSMAILQYGKDVQNACLKNIPCPVPAEYGSAGKERLQMDCSILNDLFFNGFYHPYLMANLPLLHKLCMKYIINFGIPSRINMEAANRKLLKWKEDLCCRMPDIEQLFNCYYEYYVQSTLMDIFEDYSFLRFFLYGMAKINMLWVLLALYVHDKKSITEEELAEIIAVYERRAPQIKDAMTVILPKIVKSDMDL